MGEDHLQARLHVLEPGLDFGLGQVSCSQAGGLCDRGGFGRSGIQNGLGQASGLRLGCGVVGSPRRLTGLRPANLA